MVCPYIVSRDHKKLVKPHELQIIKVVNIQRNIINRKICKKDTSSVASYIGSDRTGSDVEKIKVVNILRNI